MLQKKLQKDEKTSSVIKSEIGRIWNRSRSKKKLIQDQLFYNLLLHFMTFWWSWVVLEVDQPSVSDIELLDVG